MKTKTVVNPMKKRDLRKIYPTLKLIAKLEDNERKELLPHLKSKICHSIYECVHNGISNEVELNYDDICLIRKKLSQHKKILRYLSDPNFCHHTKRSKLNLISSGIGIILNAVLPILAQYLFNKKHE
jgi:hypothetical protein